MSWGGRIAASDRPHQPCSEKEVRCREEIKSAGLTGYDKGISGDGSCRDNSV